MRTEPAPKWGRAPVPPRTKRATVTTYIIRRLLYSIPVLFAASFLVFAMVSRPAIPLGTLKMTPNISQQTIDLITERKHLDEPIPVRYFYWLEEAVTDKFGSTIIGERPIWTTSAA